MKQSACFCVIAYRYQVCALHSPRRNLPRTTVLRAIIGISEGSECFVSVQSYISCPRRQLINFYKRPPLSKSKRSVGGSQYEKNRNAQPVPPCVSIRELRPHHRQCLEEVTETLCLTNRFSEISIIHSSHIPQHPPTSHS